MSCFTVHHGTFTSIKAIPPNAVRCREILVQSISGTELTRLNNTTRRTTCKGLCKIRLVEWTQNMNFSPMTPVNPGKAVETY